MWPFKKKPKEAAISINKNAYLSVLMPGSRPTPLQLGNPDGSNGALPAFVAPLNQEKNADLLSTPFADGPYVVATKDQKTLVQADFFDLAAVSGFRLPDDAASQAMVNLDGERLQRAQRSSSLANLVIKGHSHEVYDSIRFFLDVASRVALLTDGVVADPLAETYRLPDELKQASPLDSRIDFRDVGSIKAVRDDDGVWVSTRGMAKFNLPEYEIYGVADSDVTRMGEMLVLSGQEALLGSPVPLGVALSTPFGVFQASPGTRNRHIWVDRPAVTLSPGGS